MSERVKPIDEEILEEMEKEADVKEEAETAAVEKEEPSPETEEEKEEGSEGKAQEEKAAPQEEPKETKNDELNDKYMRLLADFQNQKRRFEKEKADIYQFANEDIVKNILEVLDNFDRAIENSGDVDPKFAEGVEMIYKQLWGVLEKAGVSEIKALGEDFDPNFHSAVMMEDSEEYESNKITKVLQKGYMLNSRVVRPSTVVVAN